MIKKLRRTLRKRGFTLLEIIISVFIIALLAGVTLPAVRKYQRAADTKTAAYEVRSEIMQAKNYALAPGTTKNNLINNYAVYFDLTNRQYRIIENYGITGKAQDIPGTTQTLPDNLAFEMKTDWRIDKSKTFAIIVFLTGQNVAIGMDNGDVSTMYYWNPTILSGEIKIKNTVDTSEYWIVKIYRDSGLVEVATP